MKAFITAYSMTRLAVAGVLMALALTGCIKNDIPYPRIQPDFLSIEAEGQTRDAVIDTQNRFITLTLGEDVDIENVNITSYTLSEGARIVDGGFDGPVNLKRYRIVTLKLYQEYDWVIQGVQNIERYFTVENQIGATIIDVVGRRVVVTLSENQGLKSVKVLTMKLGPEGSSSTPELAGSTINLENPVEVMVKAYGREEKWTIFGETVASSVATSGADAFTQVAWVYGAAIEGRDNGVEYRIKGAEEWIRVPADWITHTGSTFSARLVHLNPETIYEARAYSDDEYGTVCEFTTGSIMQVPNSSFDNWNLVGRVWNPWGEGQEPYWDTGNKGATTLGDSNTTPTDTTSTGIGDGYAARLLTKFVGIGTLGKLAAGNIFVGSYVRTDGTNGVLSFGRPFTQRPTKLHGYWKYRCTPISHTNNEYTHLKGVSDTCTVWVALIDSPEPIEIRTNPSNRHLFDPAGSEVVAYGAIQSGVSIPEYVPFEVELTYRSYSREPKYILIVGSASKYGDFFTGGNGSVLYLDDLELLYDY